MKKIKGWALVAYDTGHIWDIEACTHKCSRVPRNKEEAEARFANRHPADEVVQIEIKILPHM